MQSPVGSVDSFNVFTTAALMALMDQDSFLTLQQKQHCFLKNGPSRPLFRLFSVFFKQTIQFQQQINVKKCQVHPVSGAGIRTHDLWIVSLLP